MHARQRIREAIYDVINDLALPMASVEDTDVYPRDIKRGDIVASVYTTRDETETDEEYVGRRILTRTLAVAIEVIAGKVDGEEIQVTMDRLAVDIEREMAVDETFGSVCESSYVAETEIDYRGDSFPVGEIRLVYRIIYRTRASDPTRILGA